MENQLGKINEKIYLWFYENNHNCRDEIYKHFYEKISLLIRSILNKYQLNFKNATFFENIFDDSAWSFLKTDGIYYGTMAYWKNYRNSTNSVAILRACILNTIKWNILRLIKADIQKVDGFKILNEVPLDRITYKKYNLEPNSPETYLSVNRCKDLIAEIIQKIYKKPNLKYSSKVLIKKYIKLASLGFNINQIALKLKISRTKVYSTIKLIKKLV